MSEDWLDRAAAEGARSFPASARDPREGSMIGRGIGIAGMWVGVGLAVAFGNVPYLIAFGIAFVATLVLAGPHVSSRD